MALFSWGAGAAELSPDERAELQVALEELLDEVWRLEKWEAHVQPALKRLK